MPTTTWQDLLDPGGATDFFSRREFPPFEPEAAVEYNHANALWLAELSRLAYRHDVEEDKPVPQPTRTSFLEKAGLKQRAFFVSPKTDTQAMLIEPMVSPPFAVLVFRGHPEKP
jgi:triacylglycerol lipase